MHLNPSEKYRQERSVDTYRAACGTLNAQRTNNSFFSLGKKRLVSHQVGPDSHFHSVKTLNLCCIFFSWWWFCCMWNKKPFPKRQVLTVWLPWALLNLRNSTNKGFQCGWSAQCSVAVPKPCAGVLTCRCGLRGAAMALSTGLPTAPGASQRWGEGRKILPKAQTGEALTMRPGGPRGPWMPLNPRSPGGPCEQKMRCEVNTTKYCH